MNPLDNRQWPTVVFLSTCGLFLVGCIWYLAAGVMNPEYYWSTTGPSVAASSGTMSHDRSRILLTKHQAVQLGDTRIVYRGVRSGDLILDLYILQLDPHYGYSHRIDVQQARKGFRLGSHHFQVLAASDAKLSLKRL